MATTARAVGACRVAAPAAAAGRLLPVLAAVPIRHRWPRAAGCGSSLSGAVGLTVAARPRCSQRARTAAPAGSGPPGGPEQLSSGGRPGDSGEPPASYAEPQLEQPPAELQRPSQIPQTAAAAAAAADLLQDSPPRRPPPTPNSSGRRRLASEEQVVALLQEAVVGPIRADVAAVAAACGRLEAAQQAHATALMEAQELLRALEGRAAAAASAVAAVAAGTPSAAAEVGAMAEEGLLQPSGQQQQRQEQQQQQEEEAASPPGVPQLWHPPAAAPAATSPRTLPPQQPGPQPPSEPQQSLPAEALLPPLRPAGGTDDGSGERGRVGGASSTTRRGALVLAAAAVGAAAGVAAYKLQLGAVPAPLPAAPLTPRDDTTHGALETDSGGGSTGAGGATGGDSDSGSAAGGSGGGSSSRTGDATASSEGGSSMTPLRSQDSTRVCSRMDIMRQPEGNKELELLELLDAPVPQPGAVKRLLMLGDVDVNISARESNGTPALAVALRWDHVGLAELLLGAGATTCARDFAGSTPLHYARSGAAVRLLVRRGAPVNAANEDRWTPLHVAAREGWVEAAQALVDAGADVSRRTLPEQFTPLHVAAVNGQFQTVRQLLAAGAAVDAATWRRDTALHRAAAAGHLAVCRLLLTAGADPALKNSLYLTPADVAPTPKLRILLKPRS
ncbi:hypothetical protein HXX76_002151 [Chlamydomonas incerta]|uniref:Uncharacterized protein n=1 Tax=Chlamydomonas incerta TaxID=51695 RepID=A0A835WAI5_CHLIN|nr:hypothetical protein HXX76_002151 [Chlamydomonas incerta]|eukprot:KAG2443808.1 hypothetical protein HXX76_002151 [Chlamydomonas incerta]